MNTSVLPKIYPVTCHTDHVGPGSVFVAIKGTKQDGSDYIPQAIARGARTIVLQKHSILSQEVQKLLSEQAITVITVDDTRKALAELSAQALGYPARSLTIIGVTGTKGKSTTAFLLEHILKTAGYKTALLSTVKNRIGQTEFPAPLTTAQPDYLHMFFSVCKQHAIEYVILEVAAQALTLNRVAGIEFSAVVFTNFSAEHAEFYPTLDDYFAAKASLCALLKSGAPLIFNADDTACAQLQQRYCTRHKISTFGIYTQAHSTAQIHANTLAGLQVTIATDTQRYQVSAPALVGEFNVYNILAAVTLAHALLINTAAIQKALASFTGVPGRLQRFVLANGATAFIDYAHNSSSYTAVLSTLRSLSVHVIVVFGAGGERDKTKRPVMGAIAAYYADILVLTSDNPRSEDPEHIIKDIKQGIAPELYYKVYQEIDRQQAIYTAYKLSKPESMIILLGKGPDEYQIIGGKKYPFSEAFLLRSLQN